MLPERHRLEKGLYRVEGPARVKVIEGFGFYALGQVFSVGRELVVPRGYTICIEVGEWCTIEVSGGRLSQAKPDEEVVDKWRMLAQSIAAPGRVLVVGEVDSGKTTFSTYLLNTAIAKGLSVAVIDADVGQNDIGWPGTIALALPEKPVSWLGELEPKAFYFIGTNTPAGCEDAVVVGLTKLLREASGRDLVIVNTDGWVGDRRALAFKCRIVEVVEPTTLVVMEGTGASEPIARIFEETDIRVVRAPTPAAARGKERELRKLRRELSYLSLLKESAVKAISLEKARLWATYTFNGRRDEKLSLMLSTLLGFEVNAEVCGNVVVLTTLGEKEYKRLLEFKDQVSKLANRDVLVSHLGGLKGYLVGIANERLEHVGIGVIEEVDPTNKIVKVRTPFDREGAKILLLGKIRLSEDGVERERSMPPIA
ncbi:MAG: Clp1/GlmU family protein [Thermofilaceae archaeon]